MPKKVINDYIFYKIVCISDDIDLCYVGSTANWKERQREHKSRCNNENCNAYKTKKYEIIRANGGWENFKMVQVGTRQQLTKREAEQIEEQYRQELKANMNSQVCFATKEHKIDFDKDYNHNYYQKNTDKILDYQKNYRNDNRDEILEKKRFSNKKNKDIINEKARIYTEQNRTKINEKAREKVECEYCNKLFNRSSLTKHIKAIHN